MPYAKPVYFSENGQLANVTNISGTDTIAFRQDDSTQKWDTLIVPNLLNDDNNGVFKIKGSYNSAEHDLMTFDCSINGSSNTIKLETNRHANDIINITNSISTLEHPNDTISAIYLKATEGGIGLHWNNSKNLWAEGGKAIIKANENENQAIKLHASTGQNQTIQIINDEGTIEGAKGNGAIDIKANDGGIGLRWNDSKNLWGEGGKIMLIANHNSNDSIVLNSANGGIDILASSASGGEDIDIIATGSSVNITSSENVSDSIKLQSFNGGIDILASDASAGEDIDIVATGSSVNITSTENVSDSIKLQSFNGGIDILASGASAGEDIDITATGSSVNITSTETVNDAINLNATTGGIKVTCDDDKSIVLQNETTDTYIKLNANNTTSASETIQVVNADGNGDAAIKIEASSGGLDIDAAKSIHIQSTENTEDSIEIKSTAGGINILASDASAGEDIDIHATGSSVNITSTEIVDDAINLSATTGGIKVTCDNDKSIVLQNESTDTYIKLNANNTTAGSETIQVVNADGNGNAAIKIEASSGGLDIDAAKSIHIQSTENTEDSIEIKSTAGGINILASGASAGEDIDIVATGSSVNITSTENAEDSIEIESTAGGINILASGASSGEDIDIIATGSSVNIKSTETVNDAINLNTTTGGIQVTCNDDKSIVLQNETTDTYIKLNANNTTAGSETIQVVNADGNSDAAIKIEALSGGLDIDAAKSIHIQSTENTEDSIQIKSTVGGINILASGASAGEDIDIHATGSSVNITSTETVNDAINLSATTGGIKVTCDDDKSIVLQNETTDTYIKLNANHTTAGSETIQVVNADGNGDAAIKIEASSGGLDIDAAKSIHIQSTENTEDSIEIKSTVGGINILASGASAGEDIDINATGSSVNITSTETVNDAINLSATTGGIQVTCDNDKSIVLQNETTDTYIKLNANNTTAGSETIQVVNADGNGDAAIKIEASSGGLDIDAAKSIHIQSTENTEDSIEIKSTVGGINILASGASAGEDIDIIATGSSVNIISTENAEDSIEIKSTVGGINILASGASAGEDIDISATGSSVNITSTETVNDAINLSATTGGIQVTCDDEKSIVLQNEAKDTYIKLNANHTTAGSETIQVVNADGNSDAAIKIKAEAGGIDIDAAKSIHITSTESANDSIEIKSTNGGINILAAGASADEDINITATGSSVNITSTEDQTNAIFLNASNAAGGIDINSGTGGIDVDTTGEINIETTKSGQSAAVFTATNGGIDITAGANSTWKTTTGTLTIQGAGVSKYGDDTATLDFDGSGAVSETGMTSLTLTPSSTVTIQGAGVSKYGDDIATLDFDGSGAVSETGMTSLTLNPSGNVIIQSGGSLTYGDSVSTLVFDGSGNLANTTDLQSFQIITENSDLDSIKLASGNGGIDINASDILAIDSSTGINIGKEYANPIDIDATTLDIDASGALTLDSDTSISIGNKDDKPIDIDASTLKINTSDDTNITLTSNKVGTGTLKIEATNSGSGSSHIDMNTDGNVTINSTLGFSLDTSASEIDLTTTGTVDINSGPFTLDSSTVSIDATDDTNITLTSNKAGIGTFKIEATNNGSGSSHIDMNTDGNVTVDSTLGISLDAGNTSNFTTSNGALSLFGATGVNINGNSSEIDITTTGALDINSGTFNIDSTGGPSHIISNASGANQDFEIKLTGTTTSKIGIISEGNGDDVGSSAIDISATQGGLSLLSKKTMNLTTTSANNADISIKPGGSGTLHLGKSGNTEVKIGTDTVIDGSLNCKDLSLNGSTTISENLNVLGNLNVTGNINQINSDQINILDKNIILASNNNVDSYITDAGLILKGAGDKKFTWNNGAWVSTENIKINKNNSKLSFGTDSNVELTHVNNTGLLLSSGKQIQFGESGENISGDGTNLTIASGDGIIMNATGSLTIDSAGSASNILHTGSAHGDFTIAMDGDVDASLILKSTGTAQDALQIITTQGGINITNGGAADEEEDIDITSTNSSINLTAGEAVADAIKINASNTGGGIDIDAGNKGISLNTTGILNIDSVGAASHILHTASTNGDFTIGMDGNVDASLILSSTGTGTDALQVTASAGGMDITSSGVMDITTSGNNSNINIKSHGSGTVGIGSITNTAITLDSKSFSIDAVGDASNITLATDDDEEDLTIGITGSTNSSLILSSTGTAEDALQIITTQGGINITNGGAANGEDIDITSTNSSINLTAGEAAVDAIKINASNAGSGIDIDSGNKGISINTTGILNIDSVGAASHILHTASANGDFTIGMDGNVDASLILSSSGTGTDALQVTASAGGMDITSSGVMDITTSGNNSNISIEPHGSGVLQLGSSGGGNTEVTLDLYHLV